MTDVEPRCLLCEGICPLCGGPVGAAAGSLDWILCSMCHATFQHEPCGKEAPYVECRTPLVSVDDALDLVSMCVAQKTTLLLIDESFLPLAFYDLSTRFAGEFIQKLMNYSIQVAAIVPPRPDHGETFKAFLAEARRGAQFRVFSERDEAEAWLSS